MDRVRISKFLSLVLRHRPEAIGARLDGAGFIDVDELLALLRASGRELSRERLFELVASSPKQRFALSEDGRRIRASQGHSIRVDLGYEPAAPPELLFHGTIAARLTQIRAHGLCKMQRHHVHLSADAATAANVGARRGKPVVLRIAAGSMHRAEHSFYLASNGVWLTEHVPASYIEFPSDE